MNPEASQLAGNSALVAFTLYLGGVFVLAWLANRVQRNKEFSGEYFIGSKSLGLWAFALTAAATSASGGSFMGFPSLIYTHGWVLGWWISGYILVPLVTLGLMAKRINQVGRISGAITIPELLLKRFDSPTVGTTATILLVFFMFFFLLAQFKAGAEIMATLLDGIPSYEKAVSSIESISGGLPWVGETSGDYLLCLGVFAVTVIVYTAFGGFRAVVWTDVMQGFVMAAGVIILLFLTLGQVGGLERATRELSVMTPPEHGTATLRLSESEEAAKRLSRGSWIVDTDGHPVRIDAPVEVPRGGTTERIPILRVTSPNEIERLRERGAESGVIAAEVETEPPAYGAETPGVYVTAPGPSARNPMGFLSVTLAFSFFVFWNFAGVGQPVQQVRQMAYDTTATLRRSIILVMVFFSIIYFPLVVIFTSARVLIPGMEIYPDRVMPELAAHVTASAGVPWLAGLLVAAPFAAVMSSVDSFLLLVTSGVVRDIYHSAINPNASEKVIRRLSYTVTVVIGLLAMLAALNPPRFLQDMVVFASGGLGASFLMPVLMALYWRRMNARAATAGMISGGLVILVFYLIGYFVNGEFGEYNLLGIHPFVWAMAINALVIYLVSRSGECPDERLVEKYFGKSQ